MKKIIILMASLFLAGCAGNSFNVPPGKIKKYGSPGQVKKVTGCNYHSGKCK